MNKNIHIKCLIDVRAVECIAHQLWPRDSHTQEKNTKTENYTVAFDNNEILYVALIGHIFDVLCQECHKKNLNVHDKHNKSILFFPPG